MEQTLLRRAVAGDHVAAGSLLADYETALFRLCEGVLRHPDDAADAVQETFLRVLRGISRFRGEARFKTWIYRVALNVCLEWKRSRRPVEPLDQRHHEIPVHGPGLEVQTVDRMRIQEALSVLLPRHRAVLLLKERDGWSVAEIADAFGWNEKRVHNELYCARRTLAEWRMRSEREGVEP